MPKLSDIPKVCAYGGTLPARLFERTITLAEIAESTVKGGDALKSIVEETRAGWEAEISEAVECCGDDSALLVETLPFVVQNMPDDGTVHVRWAIAVYQWRAF